MVSLLLTVFLTTGASCYYFRHAGLGDCRTAMPK